MMNVKRLAALLCSLVILVCAFTSLASCNEKDVVVLNVYNWGEYISDGEDGTLNVNAEFE